jgi:uncharacterized protein (DUF433 family)
VTEDGTVAAGASIDNWMLVSAASLDDNRNELLEFDMPNLTRITRDPAVMGGKPCIRGMRVTVGTVVGLVAAGRTREEILREYPYLEAEDIAEALSYAAWRAEEVEVPLRQP